MCLEIKDSIAYKCPEKCFGALISDQNEKPHIFHKIDIPEINVQLFEKILNLMQMEALLGKTVLIIQKTRTANHILCKDI